jgi:hypothetical protein
MINKLLSILLQVTCIFIFLTVFFFTYVSNEEKKVVENQIDFLIDNVVGANLNILPNEVKENILSKINNLSSSTTTDNDSIKKSNDSIRSKATKIITVLSIVVIVIFILSIYLNKTNVSFFKNLSLSAIFKETGIIVLFVGLTEYIFLTYFGSKWISIDPNVLKAHLFGNLAAGFSNSSSS